MLFAVSVCVHWAENPIISTSVIHTTKLVLSLVPAPFMCLGDVSGIAYDPRDTGTKQGISGERPGFDSPFFQEIFLMATSC